MVLPFTIFQAAYLKRILMMILMSIIISIYSSPTNAQQKVKVEIKITKLISKIGTPVAHPYYKENADYLRNEGYDTDITPYGQGCLEYGNYFLNPRDSSTLYIYDTDINLKSFTVSFDPNSSQNIFSFKIWSWEDQGARDRCNYDRPNVGPQDNNEHFLFTQINLNDFKPGVFSGFFSNGFANSNRFPASDNFFIFEYKVRYSVSKPDDIQIKNTDIALGNGSNSKFCPDKQTTLKTNTNQPHKENFEYVWEYNLQGDIDTINSSYISSFGDNCTGDYQTSNECGQNFDASCEQCIVQYDYPAIWKTLGVTSTDTINFNPFSAVFQNDISKIGDARLVNFRVKARASTPDGLSSTDYLGKLGYGVLNNILFLPPAPTITSYPTVASCSNQSTGKILLKGIKGFTGDYEYVVLKGGNNTSLCKSNSDNANQNCITNVEQSGTIPKGNSDYEISGLKAGAYTLKLLAKGVDGACATRFFNITVPEIPALQISLSPTNISCFGANDGSLTFAPLYGKNPYTITVIDPLGNTLFNQVSPGSNLNNLKPGIYKITITDFCQTVSQNITLIEPTSVSIAKDQFGKEIFETNGTTCAYPGNGTLKVQSTGGSPTNAKYKYTLYKYNFNKTDSTAYRTKSYDAADAQNNKWILNDLQEGKYNLYIYDAERNCKPFIKYFEISGLAPIVIKNVKTSNISCFGTNQGSIIITPFGGTGKYKYRIKNTGSGQLTDQPDSTFSNLYAGSYQITLLSGEPGCQDNYVYPSPVTISEANKIIISTSKTDIKCNGDNNATITATVQGGSGAFNYIWEKSINNQWSTFATDKINLTQLSVGTYRLKVQDKSSSTCEIISDPINISEPDPLLITAVKQIRPGCVSDKVNLKAILSGGALPYQTLYALDGVNYTQFDENTLLGLGTYSIKVTDSNNCSYTFPDPVKITENAVNITVKALAVCYKQTNGKIKLTVEGGELPYQYSIDNGQSYHDKPDFDNVATGSYNIIVKDNRGCTGTATAKIEQRKDKPETLFLVSSLQSALDTIVVVDISRPLPDKVKWTFDKNTQVIDSVSDSPKIRFPSAGIYSISMRANFGDCEYSLTKTITIKPYDPNTPKLLLPGVRPIEVFSITPNPNTGEFSVKVGLVKSQPLIILIYNIRGDEVYRKNWEDIKEINEAIKLQDSQSGAFLVRVITENDAKELKMIVNK